MGQVSAEIAKIEAQFAAVQKNMATLVVGPTGMVKPDVLKEQNLELARNRAQMLENIAVQGQYNVTGVKLVTQSQAFTESLIKENVGIKSVAANYKILGAVYKEQMGLRQAMMATWTKGPTGAVTADLISPRNVGNATRGLSGLRSQLGFYNTIMGQVSASTVNWGKNTQWAGRQLMAGLTMPIAMLLGGLGALAFQMDKQLVDVTKVYGNVTDKVQLSNEQIRKDAQDTAASMAELYGVSSKQTLEITGQLAAIGLTGQELRTSVEAVTKAQILGGLNVDDAIKTSITLQSAYGMNAKQTGDAFAYMNAMENATSLTMKDFTLAIPKVAGVMKIMNVDLVHTGILLAAMKSSGIPILEGANALKSMAFKAGAPSKGAMTLFQSMTGQSYEDFRDQYVDAKTKSLDFQGLLEGLGKKLHGFGTIEKLDLVKQLFGVFQGSKSAALALALVDDTNKMVQRAKAVAASGQKGYDESVVQEMKAYNESMSVQIKKVFYSISTNAAIAGQQILGMAMPILKWVSKLITGFKDLSDGQKKWLLGFLAIVGLVGPVIMLVGLMGNLIGNVGKFTSAVVGLGVKFKILTPEHVAANLAAKAGSGAMLSEAEAAQHLSTTLQATTATLQKYTNAQMAAHYAAEAKENGSRAYAAGVKNSKGQYTTQQVYQSPDRMVEGKVWDAKGGDAGRGGWSTGMQNAMVVPTRSGGSVLATEKQVENAKNMAHETALVTNNALRAEEAAAKTSGHWKNIARAGGGMVGTAGLMAAMVAPSGSIAGNLGMAAMAVGMMGPGIAKFGGAIGGLVMKIPMIAAIGPALSTGLAGAGAAIAAMAGPLLIIGAAVAAIGVAWVFAQKEAAATRAKQDALNNATKDYAKVLGFAYTESAKGSGKAATSIDLLVARANKFKETNKAAADEMANMFKLEDSRSSSKAYMSGGSTVETKSAGSDASAKKAQTDKMIAYAFQQSLDAAIHGANPEQAVQAGKLAMKLMGAGMEETELFVQVHGSFDYSDFKKVSQQKMKQLVDDLRRSATEDIGTTSGPMETVARWATQTTDLNSGSAQKLKGQVNTFWSMIGATPPNQQKDAFAKGMQDFLNAGMNQAYAGAQKKAGPALKQMGITTFGEWAKAVNEAKGDSVTLNLLGAPEDQKKFQGTMDGYITWINELGNKAGLKKEEIDKLYDPKDLLKFSLGFKGIDNNVLTAATATRVWANHMAAGVRIAGQMSQAQIKVAVSQHKTKESGYQLTAQEELQYLNSFRLKEGLEATHNVLDGVAGATTQAAQAGDTYATAMDAAAKANGTFNNSITINGQLINASGSKDNTDAVGMMINARKSAYSGAMQSITSAAAQIQSDADAAATDALAAKNTSIMDALQKHNQAMMDKLQAEGVAMNKVFDSRSKALSDSQKRSSDRLGASQESQTKAVTAAYDKRIAKIDAAIKAESEAEKTRQAIFAAEKTRIQQMAEMFSKNIDFNAALNSGNLDSAAKISNDMRATDATNSMGDAGTQSQGFSDSRTLALEKTKTTAESIKTKKLSDIKTVQDAEKTALDNKSRREQAALDREKQRYNDGLASRQKAATAQNAAVEKAAQKQASDVEKGQTREQQANARARDAELAALNAYIPKNQAELNAHTAAVEKIYQKYGGTMLAHNKSWAGTASNSLVIAVRTAAASMSSDVAWAKLGADAAKQMTQGAFNMSPAQFMTWVSTGAMPDDKARPNQIAAAKRANAAARNVAGTTNDPKYRHTGGIVGDGHSNREGFSGPMSNMEENITALQGEGILSRKAMGLLGKQGFHALNKGQHLASGGVVKGPGTLGGGMFGMMMAAITRRGIGQAVKTAGERKQAADAAASGGGVGGGGGLLSGAGMIWQQLAAWVHANLPGAQITSAFRPGAISSSGNKSMHALGQAVDIAPPNMAMFDKIKSAFGANISELIYTPAGGNMVKNGHNVPTSFWGGTVLQDHYNHVHWGMSPEMVAKSRALASLMPSGGSFAGGSAGSSKASYISYARSQMGRFRWGPDQMNGLIPLWNGESGWNPRISNGGGGPDSGRAFGIPQALPGKKMASSGADWRTNAATQIDWGLKYIKGRPDYGSPNAAYSKWLGRSPHWYAGGGQIPGNHNQDTVPIWGTPGEVMVPKKVVGNYGGPNRLMSMLGFNGGYGKQNGRYASMPGLRTGGFTMSDGLALLHKNETVLTEPLSKKLNEGINNMDKSQHTVYDVKMDFTGASFTNDMDMNAFQKSVEDAMHNVDKRTGSGAASRNVRVK